METLSVVTELDDWKRCAMAALLQMFAEARGLPLDKVSLSMTVVDHEDFMEMLIKPVVIQ